MLLVWPHYAILHRSQRQTLLPPVFLHTRVPRNFLWVLLHVKQTELLPGALLHRMAEQELLPRASVHTGWQLLSSQRKMMYALPREPQRLNRQRMISVSLRAMRLAKP